MSEKFIRYQGGYKYQLFEEYVVTVGIAQANDIVTDFIDLSPVGRLVIKKGYAWDGPSGPTFDTLNFMRGSLVHDALYQLMRQKHLDRDVFRDEADDELEKICREDGMSWARSKWVHLGVRVFGGKATEEPNPVITAPEQNKTPPPVDPADDLGGG